LQGNLAPANEKNYQLVTGKLLNLGIILQFADTAFLKLPNSFSKELIAKLLLACTGSLAKVPCISKIAFTVTDGRAFTTIVT